MDESLRALRRVNPRTEPDFAHSLEAVRTRVGTPVAVDLSAPPSRRRRDVAAGMALAVLSAVAVSLVGFDRPAGVGVGAAGAAVRKAGTVTAAEAERSGTATVRITHDGDLWAEKRVSWNGDDLSLTDTSPGRGGRAGSELLVVDGLVYGTVPEDGSWIEMGTPATIDPDSGTTPADYLAAVREDVGGTSLRRLTEAMTALTTRTLADGSTVYGGTVPAGEIARGTGFKQGRAIRVLPFGYVAHDEAADPASPLRVAVTVGADGVVGKIAVTWGTWAYTVAYSGLGATPAPTAPTHARSLLKERLARLAATRARR